MTTSQPLNLDAIEAKAAELRTKIDRKNPWPSDNESHWTAEGWKTGTRNALDKLHPEAMADEIRRLRDQLTAVTALCDEQEMAARMFELSTPEWIVAVRRAIEPAVEGTHVVADDSDDPEPSTRPCGHDDYHDTHEWADRPGTWCPGISYADDEPAARP